MGRHLWLEVSKDVDTDRTGSANFWRSTVHPSLLVIVVLTKILKYSSHLQLMGFAVQQPPKGSWMLQYCCINKKRCRWNALVHTPRMHLSYNAHCENSVNAVNKKFQISEWTGSSSIKRKIQGV
jgi:hypothetical protein